MKSHEIAETGFYWYHNLNEWVVVEVTLKTHPHAPGFDFWICGREDEFRASDLLGEFLGPLTPPK